MAGKKGMKKATPQMIARAREFRRQGHTFEDIRSETTISLASLNRYLKDIPKPITEKQAAVSLRAHDRKERAVSAADMQASTPTAPPTTTDPTPPSPGHGPTALPDTADGYDTDGLLPDPKLVDYAIAVAGTWEHQRTTGTVFENVPVAVHQALYLIAHEYETWDYEAWLRNRDSWRAIRTIANVTVEDFSDRIGISASSVSRYEKGTRTPSSVDLHKLWTGYAALQEQALVKYETILAFNAAFQHAADQTSTRLADVEADPMDLLRWIFLTGRTETTLNIRHIKPLAHVRSLIPYPPWRVPSLDNLYLAGYANGAEEVRIEETEAGAA